MGETVYTDNIVAVSNTTSITEKLQVLQAQANIQQHSLNKSIPQGTGIMDQLSGTHTYSTNTVPTWSVSKISPTYETVSSLPIEKLIYPHREFIVYKEEAPGKGYSLWPILNSKPIPNGVNLNIPMAEGSQYGYIPEQLLFVAADYVESNNEDEDINLTNAVKHMRIALAYMEKHSMEVMKEKV